MAMNVRFTDEETEQLRIAAEADGVSMNDYTRTAVREQIARRGHERKVADSAARGAERYAEALHRLGTL
ncbi:plasmid mobilization protein [Pseudonocardia phyllosphaerae]|uniref:plasmid mobilization protein n=1 Tax=Pseudonocardia phyllosphaerae TaxID=3390502 RepID=UPI00397CCCCB